MRKRTTSYFSPTFLVLIAVSGFSAITYELLWLRRLNLLLGSDSYALAITLASFMAGLGLGSWYFGRLADRYVPLTVYRWLELGIGVFALLSPALFSAGALPYRFLFKHLYGQGALFLASKFAVAFLVLLLPTFLMGGTLPAAARVLTRAFSMRGRSVALAYGMNTLGAAIASIAVPFFLMPRFDLRAILWLAVVGNATIFLGTFLLTGESLPPCVEPPPKREKSAEAGRLLLVTIFISGFISLALETVWNRLFSIFFTSSIYTFSIVLVLYLVPVAAGSLLATTRRIQARSSGAVYAWCQFGIAAGILLNLIFMDQTAFIQVAFWKHFPTNFDTFLISASIVIAIFTAFINLLFGLSFPSALAYLTTSFSSMGAQTGRLAALNTAGTSLASLVVTFLLYGTLGSRLTLVSLALMALVNFAILAPRLEIRRARTLAATGIAVTALIALALPWDLKNFHLLLCQRPDWAMNAVREGTTDEYKKGLVLLDFQEDKEAVVSVVEDVESGGKHLFINGKPDASDFVFDLPTQYLIGYLPFLYHPIGEPEDVLVIGVGSGATTYAASCQGPRKLLTVEISPDVVRAARKHFGSVNHGVMDRFPAILDDGRNYLQNTQETFDIIISEPTNPWITGVSNLYTREFFRTVKAHLKPGGLFCMWIQYYRMDMAQIDGIVATVRETFPHLNAYDTHGDMIFVASDQDLTLDPERLFRPSSAGRALLNEIKISPPESVLSQLLWDSGQASRVRTAYPTNRDDRNWLEWDAPKSMVVDSSERNFKDLLTRMGEPRAPLNLSVDSSGGRWNFKEMALDAGPFNGAPPELTDYGVIKKAYLLPNQIIESSFYCARFSWGEGDSFSLLSPIMSGPIEEKEIIEVLEYMKPTLPGTAPMSFSQDGTTHLALADMSGPLRWTGFWTCKTTNRTYLLCLDSANRIRSQKDMAEFIKALTCSP